MRVELIRHGETLWQGTGRYQGQTDVPLSEQGRQALSPASFSPEKVYITALQRTRQTAERLFPQARLVVVEDLGEMNFGRFEGRSAAEMEEDPSYRAWVEGMCRGQCPGGESLPAFSRRVCRAFARLLDWAVASEEEQLVLVVHGGTQMAVMEAFAIPSLALFFLGSALRARLCTGGRRMVRTPPTALAGKAGLYKRGMTWNLWWLGHSASAWTSCWGTQAGFPILWYGWAGQFPAWKSGCGGFFPRRRGENGPQVLCLRSCCRQGLWHLPFLYCGLLGRFILGFASFWRFSGGGRRWLYGDWGRKVAGFIGALREGTLEQASRAVARIVGRDTQRLDRAGVTRAAVETVAENFSDGVAAPCFTFSWAALPWPSAIRPSIPWTVWWGTGMNGISTLAAGRPGWTMEPTGFPPSVGVAAGGGGLALGGGWERCLADLAPGPAPTTPAPTQRKQRRRWPERWGFSWPDQLGILGYGWKNRPLESISARLYQRIFCAVTGCSMGQRPLPWRSDRLRCALVLGGGIG